MPISFLPDHLIPWGLSSGRSQGSSKSMGSFVGSSIRATVECDGRSSILVRMTPVSSAQINKIQEKGGVSPECPGVPTRRLTRGWVSGTYFCWSCLSQPWWSLRCIYWGWAGHFPPPAKEPWSVDRKTGLKGTATERRGTQSSGQGEPVVARFGGVDVLTLSKCGLLAPFYTPL